MSSIPRTLALIREPERIDLIVRVGQTMLLQGGTQAAIIAVSAVFARSLDPGAFGQYAFGFQMGMFMATVACMGSATTMAKCWGTTAGSLSVRRETIFRIHNHLLVRGVLILGLSIPVLAVYSESALERTSYLIVFSLFIVMQQFNYFAATARAPLGNVVQFSRAAVALLVALAAAHFMAPAQVVQAVVAASTAMALGCLLWNGARRSFRTERPHASDLRGFTFQHWVSVLMSHTDIILLRLFLDSESIAVFAVALFLKNACAFGLYAINANTVAAISEGARTMPRPMLQSQLTYYAWVATVLSALFVGLVVLIGHYSGLIFGDFYSQSYTVFLVLLVGQAANVLCGGVALILNVFGETRRVAQSLTAALVLKVVLSVALMPSLGLWGVALGASVSMAAWNLFLLYVVRTRLGLNPTIFPFAKGVVHESPA